MAMLNDQRVYIHIYIIINELSLINTRPGKHVQKTMERSTILFSWVNPLFRLGHVQVRKLSV